MTDREKVIKGLECIAQKRVLMANPCKDCRYSDCPNYAICIKEIASDAIALLKEQEVVEPKKVKGYNPPMCTLYEYECEKCKTPIMNKQPFCMGCGQAVKWE